MTGEAMALDDRPAAARLRPAHGVTAPWMVTSIAWRADECEGASTSGHARHGIIAGGERSDWLREARRRRRRHRSRNVSRRAPPASAGRWLGEARCMVARTIDRAEVVRKLAICR